MLFAVRGHVVNADEACLTEMPPNNRFPIGSGLFIHG